MRLTITRCEYVYSRTFFQNGFVELDTCLADGVGEAENGGFYCQDHLAAFSRWAAGDLAAFPPIEDRGR